MSYLCVCRKLDAEHHGGSKRSQFQFEWHHQHHQRKMKKCLRSVLWYVRLRSWNCNYLRETCWFGTTKCPNCFELQGAKRSIFSHLGNIPAFLIFQGMAVWPWILPDSARSKGALLDHFCCAKAVCLKKAWIWLWKTHEPNELTVGARLLNIHWGGYQMIPE